MRVRGLKPGGEGRYGRDAGSHPMRVRGLKLLKNNYPNREVMSHPMRVRGLKQNFRRALCGCEVAPHAGAWIETP